MSAPSLPLVPRWFAAMIAGSVAIVSFGLLSPCTQAPPAGRCPAACPAPSAPAAQGGLVDCVWLDRLPEDAYDPFQLYLFSEEGGRVGVNARGASAFKILIELYEFIDLGDRVQFHFPHDRRKPASPYTIEKMKKPSAYFDTVLTLQVDPQNGGRKTLYYSGPEFRDGSLGLTLPEHLRATVQQALQAARR